MRNLAAVLKDLVPRGVVIGSDFRQQHDFRALPSLSQLR